MQHKIARKKISDGLNKISQDLGALEADLETIVNSYYPEEEEIVEDEFEYQPEFVESTEQVENPQGHNELEAPDVKKHMTALTKMSETLDKYADFVQSEMKSEEWAKEIDAIADEVDEKKAMLERFYNMYAKQENK